MTLYSVPTPVSINFKFDSKNRVYESTATVTGRDISTGIEYTVISTPNEQTKFQVIAATAFQEGDHSDFYLFKDAITYLKGFGVIIENPEVFEFFLDFIPKK
jgi:hypothetical protein